VEDLKDLQMSKMLPFSELLSARHSHHFAEINKKIKPANTFQNGMHQLYGL
jgi:hypothetical protein